MNLTTRNKQNGLGIIMYCIYILYMPRNCRGFAKQLAGFFAIKYSIYRKMFVQSSETAPPVSLCVLYGGEEYRTEKEKI